MKAIRQDVLNSWLVLAKLQYRFNDVRARSIAFFDNASGLSIVNIMSTYLGSISHG